GFVNHHIAGATKLVILIISVYPFGNVAFGDHPFIGSTVTMGNMLIISAQMLIGMFLFELIYRTKISPVSMVGSLCDTVVGQAAITISISMNADSSIEFLICTMWGAFDIVSELLPHLTIILYRVYPDSHHFLMTIFRAACVTTLFGTIAETVVVMFLFGQLWSHWKLSFKIATPILHIAFSTAQFHGTRIFYRMWTKQEHIIRDQQDIEKSTGQENSGLEAISSNVRTIHLDIRPSECDPRTLTMSANITAISASGPL
ncbi:hypothetical protein K438DRAFT_1634921, partial [Mycena galopus ATCC 62051]